MQSLEQIAERIRLVTGFDIAALRTKKRDTFRVAARQLFCYYACLEGHTLYETGSYALRDRGTVAYSLKNIQEKKDTDKIIKNYVDKYEIMSKKRHIIEIAAPDYGTEESDILTGFPCPACNGRGWHFKHAPSGSTQADCVRCSGSGRLRAKVQITWEAEERKSV